MKNESLKKLQAAFSEDLRDYRCIPFWSWNGEVEETELLRQIDDMKRVGIGGFIIHARLGLTIEYLGEKWFSCVSVCLKRARALNLSVWIYDENGFPSGFAGGKLLKKESYRAQFLRYKKLSQFDEKAFCVYKKTKDGYQRIFCEDREVAEYHTLYLLTSPSNVDILNPKVVDAFIAETHEEYYKRFKESFGKELIGFFTDEPQYYRSETPYTKIAEKIYRERFGEDIRDGLIYLFLHDKRGYAFRYRYYTLLNELYVNSFYKRLYQWCDSHGCKLTGHSVEETSLYTQMWGGGACMPSYEYEHIPAIDCLERDCGTELAPKQVGSVASQLGHKFVLTETFGCAGYDVTPKELKSLGDYQYFNGVNLMCQHLIPYSIAGQGKHDYPPIFSKQDNWWEESKEFNEYFARLGYIIANTKENYDVLIIHPMYGIWMEYIRAEDRNSIVELEQSFAELLKIFRKRGVQFQFADETILRKYGKIDGDTLCIGQCKYDTVIIPDMKTLASSTYALLRKFTGKQCYLGKIEYIDGVRTEVALQSNITLERIFQKVKLKFSCEDNLSGITSRSSELGDYVFIKNYSRTRTSRVKFIGASNDYKALDIMTLSLLSIKDDLEIEPCGGLILIKNGENIPEKKCVQKLDITKNFAVTSVTENTLVLDYAALSFDGIQFGEEMPLPQLFEKLLRTNYKGRVYIKHTFYLKDRIPNLRLEMENGQLFFATLNGESLHFRKSGFDVNFIQVDLTEKLSLGNNVFIYGIEYYQHEGVYFALFGEGTSESLRTSLYYDTHIENVYLHGDFIVDQENAVVKRTTLPPVSSNLYRIGYPFFCGEICLQGIYEYDGIGNREMELFGRFVTAELEANGKKYNFLLSQKADITNLLKRGENELILRIKSSLRNLLGPHHCSVAVEPMGVWPGMFTMRGDWVDGISAYYTHTYNSVPFGIDRIEISTCL